MLKRISIYLLLISSFACGKKKDEVVLGNLHFGMRTIGKPSTKLLLDVSSSDFRNSSIASGAPTSLTIYIVKMALSGSSGSKTIFYEQNGKPIHIGSNTVDISSLFTNYACVDPSNGKPISGLTECPCGLDKDNKPIAKNDAGKCPDTGTGGVANIQVDTGVFDSLNVEFQVRAKVKGCVKGDFSNIESNGPGTQGQHTYCTKASAHTFQVEPGVAAASTLEIDPSSAEEMDYQVSKANELYKDTSGLFNLSFPIKNGVNIEKDAATTPQLTMVIDTNRMLRFYNQNKTQSPNPGMSSTRSYFFNTVFEESAFVFVGLPGQIRGFQWRTEACNGDGSTVPTCEADKVTVVAGWMTVIKDSVGKPFVVGLMPDDDNALTIIKGSNKSLSGINPESFKVSGKNYDISYSLNTLSGTIKNVDLEALLDSTQKVDFLGFQKYGGKVNLVRKL